MTYELLIALTFYAFGASITPGPNNLMLMASGANFGFKRTVPHMLGVNLGFTFMLALVGIGIIQIFDLFPISYTILRVLSTAYLLYLAWKIAASPVQKFTAETQAVGAKPMTFLQAVAFQWVNPKAWTMGITALSAYSVKSEPIFSVIAIVIVFCVVNLPAILTWAVAGTQIRRFLNNPFKTRLFNVSAALLLVGSLIPTFLEH